MVSISVDTSEIRRVIANFGTASSWMPPIVDKDMIALGAKLKQIMKEQVKPRYYTGKLEGSIQSDYNSGTKTLEIGPTAKRGNYDAGLIIELGTRRISGVPFKPIRDWGMARNLNMKQIRGAWLKIRDRGVSPHPFLMETMNRPDFQAALQDAATKMGVEIAAKAIAGGNVIGVATATP